MVATASKYGCGQVAGLEPGTLERAAYWYYSKVGGIGESCLRMACGTAHGHADYPETYFLCYRCVKRLGLIW